MRTLVSALLLAAALCASLVSAAETPNIVFILADDLGYGDPGCYNDQSKIPTPHIDRLATQGLRFTDAHTPSSVCRDARAPFLLVHAADSASHADRPVATFHRQERGRLVR